MLDSTVYQQCHLKSRHREVQRAFCFFWLSQLELWMALSPASVTYWKGEGEKNEDGLISKLKFYVFYLMHIKIDITSIVIGLLNQQRKNRGESARSKKIFIKPIYKWHFTFDFYQLLPRYMLSRLMKKLKFWSMEQVPLLGHVFPLPFLLSHHLEDSKSW